MNLCGEKVVLRPIEEADFSRIVHWSTLVEVNRFSDGDYPTSLEECQTWLQRSNSNRYQIRLAIVLDDRIIGDIELDQITWRSGDAELRIRIGETALWDKGYGTDAILTLLKYSFFSLNLSRIYLKVYADNLRAIRCYQKAGFKKEGRLTREIEGMGKCDIILMRILKREFERKQRRLEKVS